MKIILASNSPRRKELLAGLGLTFDTRVIDGIDESYPSDIPVKDVALYIAEKKSAAYTIADNELLLTADTVVVVDNLILGKPKDSIEAIWMLKKISGRSHQVITGVCMKSLEKTVKFSVSTEVTFKTLSNTEIDYYVKKYKPFDKAGAYGIQEWIGYIGVTDIKGSYFNVMGLPLQRIYTALKSNFQCNLASN